MRLKKSTKKTGMKRQKTACIRISQHATTMISKLSLSLYVENVDAFHQSGRHQPSAAVAVDYLLVMAAKGGAREIGNLNENNNEWLKIGIEEAKEE